MLINFLVGFLLYMFSQFFIPLFISNENLLLAQLEGGFHFIPHLAHRYHDNDGTEVDSKSAL